jgi:hypothetical protein
MDFYAQAALTAYNLVARFGLTASISRKSTAFDPITGEVATVATESGLLKALILPTGSTAKQAFTGADNSIVEGLVSGKFRFMQAAAHGAPFEPTAGDLVEIAGETYTVKGCTPLAPAGTPILYAIALEATPNAAP